jgi:hypothetical protein
MDYEAAKRAVMRAELREYSRRADEEREAYWNDPDREARAERAQALLDQHADQSADQKRFAETPARLRSQRITEVAPPSPAASTSDKIRSLDDPEMRQHLEEMDVGDRQFLVKVIEHRDDVANEIWDLLHANKPRAAALCMLDHFTAFKIANRKLRDKLERRIEALEQRLAQRERRRERRSIDPAQDTLGIDSE